jgi:hypothetical protein
LLLTGGRGGGEGGGAVEVSCASPVFARGIAVIISTSTDGGNFAWGPRQRPGHCGQVAGTYSSGCLAFRPQVFLGVA